MCMNMCINSERGISMARTAAKRRTNKRPNWLLRVLLIALVAFVAFQAVRLCAELAETSHKIEEIADANALKEANNESKQQQIDGNLDGTLEDKANENGMFRPGQQIYQGSGG